MTDRPGPIIKMIFPRSTWLMIVSSSVRLITASPLILKCCESIRKNYIIFAVSSASIFINPPYNKNVFVKFFKNLAASQGCRRHHQSFLSYSNCPAVRTHHSVLLNIINEFNGYKGNIFIHTQGLSCIESFGREVFKTNIPSPKKVNIILTGDYAADMERNG